MKKRIFNIFLCLIMALTILNLQPYEGACIQANALHEQSAGGGGTVTDAQEYIEEDIFNAGKSDMAKEAEKKYDVKKLGILQKMIYYTFSEGGVAYLINPVVRDLTIKDFEFDIIKNLYNAFLPFSLGLVLIYMLIDLIDKASHLGGRGFDEKFYFVALAKLIIAEWLIMKGLDIFYLITKLNNAFLTLLQTVSLSTVATPTKAPSLNNYQNLYEACKNLNILEQFQMLVPMLVLYLVNGICSIIIRFQSISKKFEMILMGSFSSIAMSGVFTDFSRGTAVRYIKKFIACVLHSATIVLILRLSTILTGSSMITYFQDTGILQQFVTGGLNSLLQPALYSFAAVGSISLAKSIINDALGA